MQEKKKYQVRILRVRAWQYCSTNTRRERLYIVVACVHLSLRSTGGDCCVRSRCITLCFVVALVWCVCFVLFAVALWLPSSKTHRVYVSWLRTLSPAEGVEAARRQQQQMEEDRYRQRSQQQQQQQRRRDDFDSEDDGDFIVDDLGTERRQGRRQQQER